MKSHAERSFKILVTLLLVLQAAAGDRGGEISKQDGWFPFQPENTPEAGVIGMAHWLDAPAGKNGFVQMKGDKFVFANGKTIKFWGANHGNQGCAPPKDEGAKRAKWYAKYGINAMRMHKFTWSGGQGIGSSQDSTKFQPELLDRFDFYSNELKKSGIYTGWSHIYGHQPMPGDRDKIKAYDEIKNAGGAHLKGSTIGLVNFAEDLQDLSIAMTVNLLTHKNPYTGMRYADDPALAFIELQNEDDIFWGATQGQVNKCPTYKKMYCALFSDWLKAKYGTHEALAKAWDNHFNVEKFCPPGENLDKRNIFPISHPWWFTEDAFSKNKYHQRMYDTARFMYECQVKFYARFTAAIRKTGYKGTIVGSCWQAGGGFTHYYNLHSDYLAGIVDRHNYFGGGEGGHRMRRGGVNSASMLAAPGSGILGTGMQMVKGRPFALSEWISLIPNEWIAEGPAIVATYGMGLQGWDASYHFGAQGSGFSTALGSHGGTLVYNVTSPTQLGQYPALARMVYRGDIKEGNPLHPRQVHIPDLIRGTLDFNSNVKQSGDQKVFSGDLPVAALAIGKVEIEFTTVPAKTQKNDLSTFVRGKRITSNTGELVWDYAKKGEGFFTINTDNTKAVIGFVGGHEAKLGKVSISPTTSFACIYVTSLDRKKSIAKAKSLLIVAIGRARNTGMRYNATGTSLAAAGLGPILLEPIVAKIDLQRSDQATVYVLDHDGRKTAITVPITNKSFTIDGRKYKTPYYVVEYR